MISLKQIRYIRYLIIEGYSVREISNQTKIPESTIRLYTKDERRRVKLEKAE